MARLRSDAAGEPASSGQPREWCGGFDYSLFDQARHQRRRLGPSTVWTRAYRTIRESDR